MRLVLFIFVISSVVVTGCSSSTKTFISEDLTAKESVSEPEYTDTDIKLEFDKKANLPKPFRLGVFFKNDSKMYSNNWRWKAEDQARILESISKSLSKDMVSSVFKIDESLVEDQTVGEIRYAAARYKADAVLVIEGLSNLRTDVNKWSLSYALVVPAFFVQGNNLESIFAIKANLWDVRNERLYLTTSSEGELKEQYSWALKKDDRVYIEKSKDIAIANFEHEVKRAFER